MGTGRVAKDVVVGINYSLTLEDGSEVDSTDNRGPMEYLHGYGNLIPGLEKALDGCEIGAELSISFPPDEGYGPHDQDKVVQFNKEQLGFEPEPGSVVAARLPDGREQHLLVVGIEGDDVTLDGNHPLVGRTLHFEVTVASLREATPAELEAQTVDGPVA